MRAMLFSMIESALMKYIRSTPVVEKELFLLKAFHKRVDDELNKLEDAIDKQDE